MLEDFRACGHQLPRNLSIETQDYTFSNGAVGKIVIYHMEERRAGQDRRLQGSKQIDRAKIEEKLRERGIELRLDTFLDEGADPEGRGRCCAT